jgi:hypothetical protein
MTDKKPKARIRKAKKPVLTEREQAQLERQTISNKARDERPEAKFIKKQARGKTNITVTASDKQDEKLHGAAMMEAFGTRSIPFINATMQNVDCVLAKDGQPSEQQYNASLAIMAAVEPENELEATLAAQMVAANECAMRCMRGMVRSDMVDPHKMYGDLANKFLRTFAAQVEALSKLRRGGEQIVKYIHVHEGGQAVVAGTSNQQRGVPKIGNAEQAYGTGATSPIPALSGSDAARDGMPIPCDAERAMQDPRWEEHGRPTPEPECLEARDEVGANERRSSAAA